jgi:hypothetical protein
VAVPEDAAGCDRPVLLYLTLAPADLDRLRGPIRLVLNQLCRALTERQDFEPASSRPARRHGLLLLLDEFAVLGKLDFFGRCGRRGGTTGGPGGGRCRSRGGCSSSVRCSGSYWIEACTCSQC